MQKAGTALRYLLISACLVVIPAVLRAQQIPAPVPGAPVTLQNAPQRDTANKTNTSQWKDERTRISIKKLHSDQVFYPDTSLRFFHRRTFLQPWGRDLGNSGSPVTNLLFTPEYRTGPSLGYHTFDTYRFITDSLAYFNTTRPYSAFTYQLGSKAEQMAEVLHTQNILPDWNFSLQYRKINSPGYYKVQRTNHDLGNVTTYYTSRDLHYKLNAALVYNKIQNDENGGILADSFLTDESFDDRRTIPVLFQNDFYSYRRSSVTTMQRDFSLLLLHSYTIGRNDTTYNADSTQYTHRLIPRFRISHRFDLKTEKYQFKDVRPDSLRYAGLFQADFGAQDSVMTGQKWFYFDNALLLNGFIGAEGRQLQFSAGFGNRFDRFRTEWGTGQEREDQINNYLIGELKKQALATGQWHYNAYARLFITGFAAGNFQVKAAVGKNLSAKLGSISIGFEQQLNNAPYNYSTYLNSHYIQRRSLSQETVTLLSAGYDNSALDFRAGFRNYLIGNYIFLNDTYEFAQHAPAFSITQVWLDKSFRLGILFLHNELAWQQDAGDAPVNIPPLMGRHQLGIETRLFGNALKIATGVDLRWHSPYKPSGYSPFFNRFFYQNTYSVSNAPETAVFFNFKIKNFRAYLMGDQLQTFFARNQIVAPGYATQDAMIRFGFNWVMIN